MTLVRARNVEARFPAPNTWRLSGFETMPQRHMQPPRPHLLFCISPLSRPRTGSFAHVCDSALASLSLQARTGLATVCPRSPVHLSFSSGCSTPMMLSRCPTCSFSRPLAPTLLRRSGTRPRKLLAECSDPPKSNRDRSDLGMFSSQGPGRADERRGTFVRRSSGVPAKLRGIFTS